MMEILTFIQSMLMGAMIYLVVIKPYTSSQKPKRKRKNSSGDDSLVEWYAERYKKDMQHMDKHCDILSEHITFLQKENAELLREVEHYRNVDRLRNTAMPTFPHLYSGDVRIKWDDDSKP